MNVVFPRLYAIMDAALVKTSELGCAKMLAESGVTLIQYRNKQATSQTLFEVSKKLVSDLGSRVQFIINDRADVAAVAQAAGAHLGQEDLAVEAARAILGPARWIGISTHTLDQVRQADNSAADYIAVGPIFRTATKQSPEPVVGVEFVGKARALTRKPLVAIGGVTLDRVAWVWRVGADAVAVAADLVGADHPGARARQYLERAQEFFGDVG